VKELKSKKYNLGALPHIDLLEVEEKELSCANILFPQ
jgi:hypothetical protein